MQFPTFHFEASTDSHKEIIPYDLWNIKTPPQRIYAQGNPKALELFKRLPHDGLSIVGTRSPQLKSIDLVRKSVSALKGTSAIILSGFATGIDAAAHEAALEAGLPTIAILAGGLNLPYPKGNENLRKQLLLKDGLMVSEFPPSQTIKKHQFLERNRIIALWSKATWIVEAPSKSGSLNTAKWARDHDRVCFATPAFPGDPAFSGTQKLLDQDLAIPFWGPHSLGCVWLDWISHFLDQSKNLPLASHEENELFKEITRLTHLRGGTTQLELFQWSLQKNWPSKIFSPVLLALTQKKRITERQGVLVASQNFVDKY